VAAQIAAKRAEIAAKMAKFAPKATPPISRASPAATPPPAPGIDSDLAKKVAEAKKKVEAMAKKQNANPYLVE
jgi:U4/U6 small nuclear ribonucleoprotein PRP3